MLANYHTHTTYCDGKNTPEEIVLYAIEKGFTSIGFSGHGYTPFDLRYCMKDTEGYIKEISELKDKYDKKIEIYCGVEEDAFSWVDREGFDYIIGSSHYFNIDEKYYPIDSDYDYFKKCLEVFNYDVIKLAEADVIFEVNTGAMSRGIRKTPYLGENLLYILKEKGGKVILSSDSHSVDTLNFYFEETEYILRNVGFDCVYEFCKGEFEKRFI